MYIHSLLLIAGFATADYLPADAAITAIEHHLGKAFPQRPKAKPESFFAAISEDDDGDTNHVQFMQVQIKKLKEASPNFASQAAMLEAVAAETKATATKTAANEAVGPEGVKPDIVAMETNAAETIARPVVATQVAANETVATETVAMDAVGNEAAEAATEQRPVPEALDLKEGERREVAAKEAVATETVAMETVGNEVGANEGAGAATEHQVIDEVPEASDLKEAPFVDPAVFDMVADAESDETPSQQAATETAPMGTVGDEDGASEVAAAATKHQVVLEVPDVRDLKEGERREVETQAEAIDPAVLDMVADADPDETPAQQVDLDVLDQVALVETHEGGQAVSLDQREVKLSRGKRSNSVNPERSSKATARLVRDDREESIMMLRQVIRSNFANEAKKNQKASRHKRKTQKASRQKRRADDFSGGKRAKRSNSFDDDESFMLLSRNNVNPGNKNQKASLTKRKNQKASRQNKRHADDFSGARMSKQSRMSNGKKNQKASRGKRGDKRRGSRDLDMLERGSKKSRERKVGRSSKGSKRMKSRERNGGRRSGVRRGKRAGKRGGRSGGW